MVYKIASKTHEEIIETDLITAKMATANACDSWKEKTFLFDGQGRILHTSYPMIWEAKKEG
ncbi:hypothetical protein F373_gp094 [Bacillus phage SP-10]|uniref:hypothetical protein n=1 Tax=Bacillus phage SP10 TaxID=941058 RepID=UPI0002198B32|nr:hypothetical protein F373_gp094 [Bacillus phage SP-10]BAK52906.1 hypothetical protein [Bacillus phage SP-10]